MRLSYGIISALAASVVAKPLDHSPKPSHGKESSKGTACAKVANVVDKAGPLETPKVAAQLAWDCLQSVPINRKAALELLDSLPPYIEWQSTTAYLKDPPPEYVQKQFPPVDVVGGLAKIRAGVQSGAYKNEYDYAFDLYKLIQSTHDGHFVYVQDIVGGVFGFGRSMPLVSVSDDGKKLPSIFAYQDVVSKLAKQNSYKPSPVETINGQPAIDFLLKFSEVGSLQDRDALWNNNFYSLGQAALGSLGTNPGTFAGGGRGRFIYPGSHTEIGFANGTKHTLENYALVYSSFKGAKSGADLYKKYFASGKNTPNFDELGDNNLDRKPSSGHIPVRGPKWPGYPKPIERASSRSVGGYYIPDPKYDDIAVLAMPSFSSEDPDFQRVVQDFLADAKKAGKKKLVIDISANGGGTILQGYDVFKQLFPHIEPEGWTRFRDHRAFDISGQKISQLDKGQPRDSKKLSRFQKNIVTLPQDYRNDVDQNGKHFTSWKQKYGPHPFHGDNFSSIIRWDLNDPLIKLSSGGIIVTGYQSRKNFDEQPLKAEDIVIVYDGYCASTCTIFSEFMRHQAGVEAIALGGRPQPGIIQAVGGVKGTNNFPWSFIRSTLAIVSKKATKKQARKWRDTLRQYNTSVPFQRAAGEPNINARDGIRPDDPTQTPRQFVWEAADCRILYTPEMTVDVTAIWKAAVDSKWRGKSRCIAGGVGGNGRCDLKDGHSQELDLDTDVGAEAIDELQQSMRQHTDLRGMKAEDGLMRPY